MPRVQSRKAPVMGWMKIKASTLRTHVWPQTQQGCRRNDGMATFQSWLVSVTAISSSKAFRRRLFKTNNRITREAQFSESFPNHQPQPNPVCSFLCLLHQALTFCRGAQLWCLLRSHYTHICSNMGVFLVFPEGKTSTPSKRHSFQTTLPNLGTF